MVFTIALSFGQTALAVEPDEVLADPRLEAKARAISSELRCLVCQNQSIDESTAPLAHDLRLLVREHVARGESESRIKAFVVERYGNFVLLKPPLLPSTVVLWFSPVILLAVGGLLVWVFFCRTRQPEAGLPPLTLTEEAELQALVRSKPQG